MGIRANSSLLVNPLFMTSRARRRIDVRHLGYARYADRTTFDLVTPVLLAIHRSRHRALANDGLSFLYLGSSPAVTDTASFLLLPQSRPGLSETTGSLRSFSLHDTTGWETTSTLLYLGRTSKHAPPVLAPFFWDFALAPFADDRRFPPTALADDSGRSRSSPQHLLPRAAGRIVARLGVFISFGLSYGETPRTLWIILYGLRDTRGWSSRERALSGSDHVERRARRLERIGLIERKPSLEGICMAAPPAPFASLRR